MVPFTAYELDDGSFATSSVNVPERFLRSFPVTDEEAAEIARGAQVEVVDGALVITPAPADPEFVPEIPADGEF